MPIGRPDDAGRAVQAGPREDAGEPGEADVATSRKLLQDKLHDVENDLRGTLRNFGLKVGAVSRGKLGARIRELVERHLQLAGNVESVLAVRRVLREQYAVLYKMVLDLAHHDPLCRRFLAAPGVGAIVAVAYQATVDQPRRFAHSKALGAHSGLTPRGFQSGEAGYDGKISRRSDAMMRSMLYETGHTLLTRDKIMVLAQGPGSTGGASPRDETGDRGRGSALGGDHASDVAGWHGL